MNTVLIYILELNLYLSLFAITYHLFYRNEPFHRINRWLILVTITLSALLPLINFGSAADAAVGIVQLEPVLISVKSEIAHTPAGYNLPSFFTIIYLLGFSISLVVFFYQLFKLRQLLKGSSSVASANRNELVSTELKSPASFFKTIIWPLNVHSDSVKFISDHELVHIREKHSIDLLVLRFFEALCWFNPFIYSLKNAIEATHEYRADEVVVKQHGNRETYSRLILSQALDINPNVLTHQFSKSKLLKRRIMMLHKQNTATKNFRKYLALIPVFAAAFLINACTTENTEEPASTEQTEIGQKTTTGEKIEGTDVYIVVDEMPEYPGGDKEMMAFLGNNIVYPVECKEEGVEGTVFVSFTIDKDGTATDIKPINNVDGRLAANAVEVVKKMPSWTPGKQNGEVVKVQYNLPIKYQLN